MLLFLIIFILLLGGIVFSVAVSSFRRTSPALKSFVDKKAFMTMVNNGKDPCECDKASFGCGNYIDNIDLYVKKEK